MNKHNTETIHPLIIRVTDKKGECLPCNLRLTYKGVDQDIEVNGSGFARVLLPEELKPPIYKIKAPDLLNKASQHMIDRAKTYDKPDGERSMGKTVQAFNTITGKDITEAEGWLLMQILKDVRLFQRSGYHADSAEDCIAYSALKAEAKANEVNKDYDAYKLNINR